MKADALDVAIASSSDGVLSSMCGPDSRKPHLAHEVGVLANVEHPLIVNLISIFQDEKPHLHPAL